MQDRNHESLAAQHNNQSLDCGLELTTGRNLEPGTSAGQGSLAGPLPSAGPDAAPDALSGTISGIDSGSNSGAGLESPLVASHISSQASFVPSEQFAVKTQNLPVYKQIGIDNTTSRRQTVSEFFRIGAVIFTVGLVQAACSTSAIFSSHEQKSSNATSQSGVDAKSSTASNSAGEGSSESRVDVSLTADREALAELRKDVPEHIRKENDEIAFILEVMRDGTEDPSRVRDRFNKLVRDRRARHDRELRRQRDEFNKKTRSEKEKFLREQKSEREEFVRGRRTSADERREFFNDQDTRRREFFALHAERSRDFESEISSQRRNFDDDARERMSRFNEEHRSYTQRFYERKKAEALRKSTQESVNRGRDAAPGVDGLNQPGLGQRSSKQTDDEFSVIPNIPAIPLGPSSNEEN